MLDFKKIARTLVERQLRIKTGEVVQINGGLHNTEFIEEITVAVRAQGGLPMVSLAWESLSLRLVNEVPDEFLSLVPKHQAQIESLVDCTISVSPFRDATVFKSMDTQKSNLKTKACKIVQDASLDKGARRIGIGYPTPEGARNYGVDFEHYSRLFWGAVMGDVDEIYTLCEKIKTRLSHADKVRILSPKGDELKFSIQGRRINMDDGVISDEDLETGDITANLPFGEVYIAPIEKTVEGSTTYPVVFHKGQRIENLRLVFEGGTLVDSSADENHELFLEAMLPHTGDKNLIGEFGIGTNPKVMEPMGDNLLDEKIFGSIHLALGENRSYGGQNSSSLHWDMIMLSPKVYIDDELLLENGKFNL
jgi:aminopeptidase